MTESRGRDAEAIPLEILGQAVDLTVRNPESRRQVEAAWSRCLRRRDMGGVIDGDVTEMVAIGSDLLFPSALGERLVHRLTDHGIGQLSGRAVMLHAAGLADAMGRVIGLVAASGVGKSSAAAYLCHEGFGYVTDETLAVLPDLSVVPFPKPLALHVAGRPDKVHLGPDALFLTHAPELPLALTRLVLLDRDPDHSGEVGVEPVPMADAVMELIGHTSALTALPRPLQALAAVVEQCRPVRLRYREAASLAPVLAELLGEAWVDLRDSPATEVEVGSVGSSASTGSLWAPIDLGDRVPGEQIRDAIRIGEQIMLLVGDRPVLLRGLAAQVWEARVAAGPEEAEREWVAMTEHLVALGALDRLDAHAARRRSRPA